MKNLIATLAIALSSTAGMAETNFKLSLIDNTNEQDKLYLSFSSIEINSAMCFYEVHNLEITQGVKSDLIGIPRPAIGKIAIEASIDPYGICLMAFGPSRGTAEINLVDSEPKNGFAPNETFSYGYYQVEINGENEGFLLINGSDSEIVAFNQIPQ